MVRDVIDGLKLVADGIKSVTTIADAVKSGKAYVTTKHADVQNDLRLLVEELGKSLSLVKDASAVLTNFRFAVSADNQGLELARFNDYFIKSKTKAGDLEQHIDDLRTHCGKIRKHSRRITGEAEGTGFTKVFTLLGLNSPEREKQLGEQLDQLAHDDYAVANTASTMLASLVSALKDVQDALGDGGAMHPENVPKAAALLAEYGSEFERTEKQAAAGVKEVRELVNELK